MPDFDVKNPTLDDAICELKTLADKLEYQAEHIPVYIYDDAGDANDDYEMLMSQAGAIRFVLARMAR